MKQEITTSTTVNAVDAATLKKYLRAANLVGHLNDAETDQFIQISTAFGLNPFKREIYASKYGNNFSIVVGYETYIKRAERSGNLAGWKVTTEGSVNFQKPHESDLKALITIHRNDFKFPFEHEVFFSEYCQRTKQGQLTRFWREKPITMIKKVVMSQGFRLCFSDELGGIPYTKEEIGNETIDTTAIVVDNGSNGSIESVEPIIEQEDPIKEEISTELQFQEAEKMLLEAYHRDDCVKIWKAFPQLQTEDDFIELVKERTQRIKSGDLSEPKEEKVQEPIEPKKKPENEIVAEKMDQKELDSTGDFETLDKTPQLFNESSQYTAEEAIDMIKVMTVDEIIPFVASEKRKTVNEYAQKQINKNENNDENES